MMTSMLSATDPSTKVTSVRKEHKRFVEDNFEWLKTDGKLVENFQSISVEWRYSSSQHGEKS